MQHIPYGGFERYSVILVGPKPPVTASLRPHGLHTIRVAAWHLELLASSEGRGAVETPRGQGGEKLGAVRQDPDLIGLLNRLI